MENRDLEQREKLRCKGPMCDMRKGFFVWPDQKKDILTKKCLLCDSDIVELNLQVVNEKK